MPASLIIFVGEVGRHLPHIADLVRAGVLVLIAPSLEEAGRWLKESRAELSHERSPHQVVGFGDLMIDSTSHLARWRGADIPLTERELQILAALAEDPGRAWSFAELTERAWGTAYYGGPATVSAAVQRLRHKLARAGVAAYVESVRGIGFRLRVEPPR
jgi:DNA-binding response OmpR family regulator